jgi:hypothetical protein
MSKRLTIDNVLAELKEAKKVIDPGYPYYGVPKTIARAIRLLTKLKKELDVSQLSQPVTKHSWDGKAKKRK